MKQFGRDWHLQHGSDDGEEVPAGGRVIHAQLEEHSDLDAGVDHTSDAEHYVKSRIITDYCKNLEIFF